MKLNLQWIANLGAWQKMTALVVALLIPLAFLAYLQTRTEFSKIATLDVELEGLEYVTALQKFALQVAEHAELAQVVAYGETERRKALRETAQAADTAAAGVEVHVEGFGEAYGTAQGWLEIKRGWNALREQTGELKVEESIRRHKELERQVLDQIYRVNDKARLFLTSDPKHYYLVVAGTDQAPLLQADLGELTAMALEVGHRGGQPSAEDQARLRVALAQVKGRLDNVDRSVAQAFEYDPGLEALAAEVKKIDGDVAAYERELEETLLEVESISVPIGRLLDDAIKVEEEVEAYDEKLEAYLTAALKENRRAEVVAVTLELGVTLLGTLLGLVLAVYLARGMVALNQKIEKENRQLNDSVLALLQAVAKLARRDLTAQAHVAEDVTGAVADALNLMTGETAKVLGEVVGVAEGVSHASEEVRKQADIAMNVALDDKIKVEQAVTELTDASETMREIARLAAASNEAAAKAISTTDKAQETVLGTVQGITAIRDVIRETEKRIKRLGERSQEIGGVVSLINNIAERTHILALNASMHAASAGEAGRGFAVVANEVQRLAESAREATGQISTLVSSIQTETADTVTTMNDTISQVVEGTRMAEQAGAQMRETRASTAELVRFVEQISEGSNAQANVTRALALRAAEIQSSTKETLDVLQRQSAFVNRLVEFSGRLVQSVGVFTLPEAAAPANVADLRKAA